MNNVSINEGYDLIKTTYLMIDDGDRRFLKQFGVTPIQYFALRWLDGTPGKTLSQLSRDLLCDPANVTRLTDRMEDKGLIARQRYGQDRRVIWVALTPAGQELCSQIRQAHADYTHCRMSVLSEAERATLHDLLNKLCNGLEGQLCLGSA